MKTLLAVTTVLATSALWASAPANAASQCGTDPNCVYDPATGISYFDPTSFHVTATGATGSDPVLLNNNTTFSIQDIGGQNIDQPLTIFIAGPVGSTPPTISSTSYTSPVPNSTTTPVTGALTRTLIGNDVGVDLYSFIGCVACDNSLNFANINTAYTANGIPTVTQLTVWSFSVPQAFVGKDQLNAIGTFANGDIVFPLAQNGVGTNHVTNFDTSWTNTGLVDCPTGSCTVTPPPPPPPPIAEPSSIALLGVGLLGIGALTAKRRR